MPQSNDNTIPRWVKVLGVIALLVALLVLVLQLTGSDHGPGRHTVVERTDG